MITFSSEHTSDYQWILNANHIHQVRNFNLPRSSYLSEQYCISIVKNSLRGIKYFSSSDTKMGGHTPHMEVTFFFTNNFMSNLSNFLSPTGLH